MAYLFIAVPNKLNDGRSVPRVQVLIDGRKLETFDSSGTSQGFSFANNSTWVLLDLLKLARWPLAQMDVPSFAAAASVCAQTITGQDNSGNPLSVPRFQCNLVLKQRRTAAEVVAGVRNNARLFLTYSSTGKLQVKLEPRGLVVSLTEAAFFPSGQDTISPATYSSIEKIAAPRSRAAAK